MHTTNLGTPSHYYVEHGKRRYVAHHNGDFSGEIIFTAIVNDKDNPTGERVVADFVIPFDDLLVLVGAYKLYMKHRHLEALEHRLQEAHELRKFALE